MVENEILVLQTKGSQTGGKKMFLFSYQISIIILFYFSKFILYFSLH